MKVLHLFDLYLPSTLSWVSQLLDAMPEIGVQVGAPWIVRGQFYNPAFQYHVFPPQRMLFPAPATEFEHPRWQRLFTASQRFVPSYPYWLRQKLKADPPDLLHAHFGPTGCLYLPLAIALQRPLVVTFYGFDYSKLPNLRPVFREKYKALFAGAARVLAASETGCEKLRSMGCPSEKLAVVKPSPNLNAFPFRNRAKPAGQLRLVQVATFTPKKGHLVALEAFRLASMDCPNLHLTLAGELQDKALVAQLRRYIAIHGLESRVNCWSLSAIATWRPFSMGSTHSCIPVAMPLMATTRRRQSYCSKPRPAAFQCWRARISICLPRYCTVKPDCWPLKVMQWYWPSISDIFTRWKILITNNIPLLPVATSSSILM
ncbi:MAG: glycosyltransferase family 4 protein [Lewinellaceae bacterium]|nr:glycosyltransferase family 4 protein [Lewinellaceae bacterium]